MAQLLEKLAFPGISPSPELPSLRSAYAKHLLFEHIQKKAGTGGIDSLPHFQPVPDLDDINKVAGDLGSTFDGKICIIGAGVAGLFTAMLLKICGIYDFDILEASDRVGGRCYTYNFPDGDENCPHNYYDIGAMRIPDIDAMKSTLILIKALDLEEKKVPYIYKNDDVPNLWWFRPETPDGSAFQKAVKNVVDSFSTNFDTAFRKFMQGDDDYFSTRTWLMTQADKDLRLTYKQTVLAEGSDTSTGLFDQAFTETICDYCDFAAADAKPWYRLEGGMSVITERMRERIATKSWPYEDSPAIEVTLNKPVVAMKDEGHTIKVTTEDGAASNYNMVFNTTAMAPLQRMDIEGLKLPDEILTGLRALSYDRATKVAIKFKSPWWDFNGGVSSTDLPISNVVYPSWQDGPDKHAVLMVSYSWAQDATRMGAVTPDYTPSSPPSCSDTVVSVCFESLVKLFEKTNKKVTLEFLREQYITHHAFAWSHDPYTGGAFALFGPGQFKDMYPPFQELFCKGKFAMSGEALSAHDAWISGALDSAYMSLFTWLSRRDHYMENELAALKASVFGGGKGKHPAEMDEKLLQWTAQLSFGGHKE